MCLRLICPIIKCLLKITDIVFSLTSGWIHNEMR